MNTAVMTPRGEAPRRILAVLADRPATQKELAARLNRNPSARASVGARYYAATGIELPSRPEFRPAAEATARTSPAAAADAEGLLRLELDQRCS